MADGSDIFTFVSKIRVDTPGPASAVGGCAFSMDGDLVAARYNYGNTK